MILKSFKIPRSRDLWAKKRGRALACLLLLALLSLSGCSAALMQDIRVSSYMQKKQHHEVIRALQPKTATPGEISAFQLYLLAGAYYEIRDYEKMLATTDLLQKAIDRGDKSYFGSDLTPFPRILRSLAYLDQGDYAKAVQEAEQAYALLNRPEAKSNNFYRSQLIDISAALGVAHAHLNHPAEVDRALAVLQGINIQMSILGPEKFLAIAKVNMAMKRFDKALQAVKDPAAKVSGLVTAFYDQTFQELPKFYILTKCLMETGAVAEAKNGYDQLLKHPQISQIGGIQWPVLLDRAKIAREEGDRALAERLLKQAAEVIEKQRSSINTEAGRIGYVGDKQAIYQRLISLLVEEGRAAEAFEYTERAKGRALVDLLASQKNLSIRGPREAGDSLSQLAQAETSLNVVADPAVAGSPGTRGVVVRLKADLSARDPELSSLVTVSAVTLPEVQKRLAEEETVLEYYAAGREWFVFVLTREGITARKLEGTGLEENVARFREALVNPDSRGYAALSQTLHRQLVGPVSGLLTKKRLTIVPTGRCTICLLPPFPAAANISSTVMTSACSRMPAC
jgi:tetratricopeptide (TPR) repeat protein